MQSVLGVIHRAGLLRRSDAGRMGVIHRAGLLRRSDAGRIGGHPLNALQGGVIQSGRRGSGGMQAGWRVRPKNEILIPE